jgi:ribosomal protein S18 acetylase RimI-like enzyme
MIIRPMVEKDQPALLNILKHTPEFNPVDLVVAGEVITDYLKDPLHSGYFILVAEVEGQIAGYVCYGQNSKTKSTWDIYWLAVAHEQQGKGIGRQLMAMTEKNIRAAHGKLIIVETSSLPINDKTQHFHLKGGYNKICQIKDFYAPGDDQILYEKRF